VKPCHTIGFDMDGKQPTPRTSVADTGSSNVVRAVLVAAGGAAMSPAISSLIDMASETWTNNYCG